MKVETFRAAFCQYAFKKGKGKELKPKPNIPPLIYTLISVKCPFEL